MLKVDPKPRHGACGQNLDSTPFVQLEMRDVVGLVCLKSLQHCATCEECYLVD